jgi:hypothetical protein
MAHWCILVVFMPREALLIWPVYALGNVDRAGNACELHKPKAQYKPEIVFKYPGVVYERT